MARGRALEPSRRCRTHDGRRRATDHARPRDDRLTHATPHAVCLPSREASAAARETANRPWSVVAAEKTIVDFRHPPRRSHHRQLYRVRIKRRPRPRRVSCKRTRCEVGRANGPKRSRGANCCAGLIRDEAFRRAHVPVARQFRSVGCSRWSPDPCPWNGVMARAANKGSCSASTQIRPCRRYECHICQSQLLAGTLAGDPGATFHCRQSQRHQSLNRGLIGVSPFAPRPNAARPRVSASPPVSEAGHHRGAGLVSTHLNPEYLL